MYVLHFTSRLIVLGRKRYPCCVTLVVSFVRAVGISAPHARLARKMWVKVFTFTAVKSPEQSASDDCDVREGH